MGSWCSCLNRDGLSDKHPTKFKVTNVDDEGMELGSGVMELTQSELVLHLVQRDDIHWPYLCLRRYGYDANLFSFESGRRCQTGQGIFAFKCSRAEEIFNLLQDLMQCNSINVMEEPVIITRSSHPAGFHLARNAQQPSALGYAVSSWSNGFAAARHPSLGEESTHALIAPDEQSHTYVNTPASDDAPRRSHCLQPLPEAGAEQPPRGPRVALQPGRVKFVLGRGGKCADNNNDEGAAACPARPPCAYENVGDVGVGDAGGGGVRGGDAGGGDAGVVALRRGPGAGLAGLAPRRPLHYENLPPLWEGPARPDPDDLTPSSNGCPDGGEGDDAEDETPLQGPRAAVRSLGLPAPLARAARRGSPRVFSFDFRRPGPEPPRQLNYIQVELKGWGGERPATPGTPATPARSSSDSYAVIDLKKTAAMSSLQRALPRDDGTARKTRHNSTDLPL